MNGPYTHKGLHNPPTYEIVIKAVIPYQQTDPASRDYQSLMEYLMNTQTDVEIDSYVLERKEPSTGGDK